MKNYFKLNKSYIKFYILFLAVIIVAVLTPHIIHGHVLIPREYAQSTVLIIDIILGYIFYILYRRDVDRIQKENTHMEKVIMDAYKHVGDANRKNEILGRFLEFLNRGEDYPSDKDIFQHLMQNIIVSVAKSDKGFLRFVDSKTSRTIKEYHFHKDGDQFAVRVSNKLLLSGQNNNSNKICILESSISKHGIKGFLCFETGKNVNRDNDFIKSLVNQVYLLFLANNRSRLQMI
jgi:hypothetical protein